MSIWKSFFGNSDSAQNPYSTSRTDSTTRIAAYNSRNERVAEHDSPMHLVKNSDDGFEWVDCADLGRCRIAGTHVRISHLVLAMKEFQTTTGLKATKVEDVSWEFLKAFIQTNFGIELRKFCSEKIYDEAQKKYNVGFKRLLLDQAKRKPTAKYNWGDWWAYSNSTSLMRVSRFTYHTHKLSEFDVTTSKHPVLGTVLLGAGIIGASVVGIMFI